MAAGRTALGGIAAAAVMVGLAQAPTASAATNHVCKGVAHCRVVAHRDVTGDGAADKVAWVQRSKRTVQIRVLTSHGHLMTKQVGVRWWLDKGAWGGAAHIDHHRGVELLVGSQLGAHTPFYTMLTERHGRLVVEKSPGGAKRWYVDAAWSVYVGWWRHVRHGHATMTKKVALRVGGGKHFRGHNTIYAWRHGHWVKKDSHTTFYKNARKASRVGGWHVHGLKRFPGL
ncbi:MAG: hypothetical protein ACRDMV_16760 [Streptosporangiales bacterium]